MSSYSKRVSSLDIILCPLQVWITVKLLNFRTPKKLCCDLPNTQTKRPNLRVFCQKDSNEIANSEYTDQTAPQGAL